MKKDKENQGKDKRNCLNFFLLNNVRKLSARERHTHKKKNLLILYKLSCELIMKDFKQGHLPRREVEVPAVIKYIDYSSSGSSRAKALLWCLSKLPLFCGSSSEDHLAQGRLNFEHWGAWRFLGLAAVSFRCLHEGEKDLFEEGRNIPAEDLLSCLPGNSGGKKGSSCSQLSHLLYQERFLECPLLGSLLWRRVKQRRDCFSNAEVVSFGE